MDFQLFLRYMRHAVAVYGNRRDRRDAAISNFATMFLLAAEKQGQITTAEAKSMVQEAVNQNVKDNPPVLF